MANPNPSPENRFKQGWKGGPGRPPGLGITEELKRLLDAREIDGKPIPGGKTVAELLAAILVRKALRGDYRFFALLIERVEGKVPTPAPEPPETFDDLDRRMRLYEENGEDIDDIGDDDETEADRPGGGPA
jgi:hypothetical protein